MSKEQVNKQLSGKEALEEVGAYGLERSGGYIDEEKLQDLKGRKKYEQFREMSDNDEVVGAIVFLISMLTRQVEWKVNSSDENNPVEVEKAEFIRGAMHDMEHPWTEMIGELMSMLVYGFAPMEKVFKVRRGLSKDGRFKSRFKDNRIGWRKFALRAQETVEEWAFDDNGALIGLYQVAPPNHVRTFIPMEKLVNFRTTIHKNNPEGRSILRNAWRSWYFKKNIEKIEAIGVERDLAGLPVIYAPPKIMRPDADPNERAIFENLKRIVVNIKRDEQEGVIMPNTYDENGNRKYQLELLASSGSRQFDTNKIIVRYRQGIAMSVLADFILMGQEKVGSFALADSKTSVFSMAIGAWLQMIADEFNRKLIPELLLLNGWDVEKHPMLTFSDIEDLDLKTLSLYINSLTTAGIDLTGDRESAFLKSRANIPHEETEEQ